MLLSSEIDSYLNYLSQIRKYSPLTVLTYKEVLYEAADKVECFEEDGKTVYNAKGYRAFIVKQSKKTIAKKISVLRSFFEHKRDSGEKIKVLGDTQIKTPKTLPKPVNTDVIKKAIESCDDITERLIVTLAYSAGLRISELENLTLDSVGGDWIKVEHGKGGKDRMVPMLPEVKNILNIYIDSVKPVRYLFWDGTKRLSQNCLRYKIAKIFQRVGYKVTPHQLRHSFATDLLNKGARITDVSELLGHKELATTKIYTKLAQSKKLDGYLGAHPLCKE